MSPRSQARPTKPTTTYATADQPAGDPVVDRLDEILRDIDEALNEEVEFLARIQQREE